MSKSYSFSLQKVFDYRKRVEEKRAVDLSVNRLNLKNEMADYNLLEDKKEKVLNQHDENLQRQKRLNLNNLKIRKDYIVQVNNDLVNQANKVDQANEKVNESREKLKKATTDKKILEKLNERKYQEYKKNVKKELSKIDNEIAGRVALTNKTKRLAQ